MEATIVHFSVILEITNEGTKRQERMREAYTTTLDHKPRLSTVLIEDCSFDIDSNATKRSRKDVETRRTFL